MDSSKDPVPSGAESPTTAKPLEFDDEPENTATTATKQEPSAPIKPGSGEDAAPPKPISKELDPRAQAELTLAEAFPAIDKSVIRAVLLASGGKVEPAFNALLSMSDPDAQHDEGPPPPPKPPRPARNDNAVTSTPMTQLEADEMYARQLAEHYNTPSYSTQQRGVRQHEPPQRQRKDTGLKPNELYDDEHSFLKDDLPVIQENIRQGFLQTQTKVNQWVEAFKKKIDGEDSLYSSPSSSSNNGRPNQNRNFGYNARPVEGPRGADRDRERYDADPRVLDDDFAGLELRDDNREPVRSSSRPLANPDLFKPKSLEDRRRVSFQDPEVDNSPPIHAPAPKAPAAKTSKWEPLSSVEPTPLNDTDPFSLGDSDDEKEKDIKSADTERLKSAAAETLAKGGSVNSDSGKKPTAAETVGPEGTRDKEAEDKLTA